MAAKKPYIPNPWSHIKPKEDDRRKLTLFIAGAAPEGLNERITKLTGNYPVVTVMCAEERSKDKKSEMPNIIEDWARKRRQHCKIVPLEDLNEFPGYMQFMQPDGNKAVIVYDDGENTDDIKFAEALSKEPDVQFKKIKVEPVKSETDDFTKAVNNITNRSNAEMKK